MREESASLDEQAMHPSLKANLRRANEHLDEALLWLHQPQADTRQSILTLVDMGLELADYELSAVRKARSLFGPDGMTIG